jgi:hypothetical protein
VSSPGNGLRAHHAKFYFDARSGETVKSRAQPEAFAKSTMSLIKNWGFQWQRQYIFRGAGSNAGHLKGYASGLAEADFREQIGVYILHNRDLRIVYVGQAGNVMQLYLIALRIISMADLQVDGNILRGLDF